MSQASPSPPPRRLVRSTRHKMLAGVCGGVGEYMDLDPTVVRVVYVLVTVFTALVPGLLAYVIMIFLVPRDDEVQTA